MQVDLDKFLDDRRELKKKHKSIKTMSFSINHIYFDRAVKLISEINPNAKVINNSQKLDLIIYLLVNHLDDNYEKFSEQVKADHQIDKLKKELNECEKELNNLKICINEDLKLNFEKSESTSEAMPYSTKFVKDNYNFEYKKVGSWPEK